MRSFEHCTCTQNENEQSRITYIISWNELRSRLTNNIYFGISLMQFRRLTGLKKKSLTTPRSFQVGSRGSGTSAFCVQCSRAPGWLFWYRGWKTTQLYGDYFISHEIRIPIYIYKPYKPIRISWNVIVRFGSRCAFSFDVSCANFWKTQLGICDSGRGRSMSLPTATWARQWSHVVKESGFVFFRGKHS